MATETNEPPICARCEQEYTLSDFDHEPTNYCDQCAHEAVEEAEAKVRALQDLLTRSEFFVTNYCEKNPKWEFEGRIQDPQGSHALLAAIRDAFLNPSTKKGERES